MMDPIAENNAGQDGDSTATAVSPGRLLREARERLGMSVADVAAQTRLAQRQIEALEADDFGRLPEMPFVRGFVRNYAKLLHLDAQPLLDALPHTKPVAAQLMPASVEVPFPDAHAPQRQNLIWLGAALLLAVVVVAFAVWHYTTPLEQPKVAQLQTPLPLPVEAHIVPASSVPETEMAASPVTATPTGPTATPRPDVAQPVAVAATKPPAAPTQNAQAPVAQAPVIKTPDIPASVVKTSESRTPAPKSPDSKTTDVKPQAPQVPLQPQPAKPATPATASTGSTALRLLFDDESWVEVKDKDGNLLSSQINARGSELRLDGRAPFTLAIGRAASVHLYHRGKQVDLKPYINSSSEVARLTLE